MENLYDLVVVGAGPAGLSAAIYMARAKYKVLVLEKEKIGGQITITSEVVNYPGVFKTSGSELSANMHKQALAFGAEFKIANVENIETEGDIKTIVTNSGTFKALGVILAPGANPRKLGFEGEAEFQGRGVAYCATCDGEFFKDMKVFVVGGGFAAVEEGIFLTKYASSIDMIVRGDDFSCAKTVSEHVYEQEKISVNFQTEVVRVEGDGMLTSITLRDRKTLVETRHEIPEGFGIFVFAGYVPNTSWLPETIELSNGYIVTDINQKTNIDGIYAAGDVCIKNLRQVVTAVSDGAIAATSLEKHVEALHIKLDIPALVQDKTPVVHEEVKSPETHVVADDTSFISADMIAQLQPIFARFENTVTVKAFLGKDKLASEMAGFIKEVASMSDKILCETKKSESNTSYMELYRSDGSSSGVKFQAIPGGHEFNSFIVGLYNVAGPGKQIPADVMTRIKALKSKQDIKILISLSCTMCPELVQACQQIAANSEMVEATMIDLQHAPELKEKYRVMSVPCTIINDEAIHFGKKSIEEVLDILEK